MFVYFFVFALIEPDAFGTPFWLAPEVMENQRFVEGSDVYRFLLVPIFKVGCLSFGCYVTASELFSGSCSQGKYRLQT